MWTACHPRAPTVAYSQGHLRSTPSSSPPGPSSPVWVPMYWQGTLSTCHVHKRIFEKILLRQSFAHEPKENSGSKLDRSGSNLRFLSHGNPRLSGALKSRPRSGWPGNPPSSSYYNSTPRWFAAWFVRVDSDEPKFLKRRGT